MRRRRTSRVRVVAAALVALMAVAVAALVAVAVVDPTVLWRVDGDAVAQSLSRASDDFRALPPCDPRKGGRWRCAVERDAGSGMSDAYVVEVEGDCWRAVRVKTPHPESPPRVDGCFGPLDFIWP